MTRFYFTSQVILDELGALGDNLQGFAYTNRVGGADVSGDLLAPDGITPAGLATDAYGVPNDFYGPDDVVALWLSFGAGGPKRWLVMASDLTIEVLQRYIDGTLAGASGIIGAPTEWPLSFPPDVHNEDIGQLITGGQPLAADVISMLKSANKAAIRSAIGAGTGNGNSNVTIGVGGAAAYDHGHTAASITFDPAGTDLGVTNVQDAIEQAALSGGSSGGGITGVTLEVIYGGGAYPMQPALAPAGIKIRHFYGPQQYVGASYAGVIDLWTLVEL